jgi:hypothetical protein
MRHAPAQGPGRNNRLDRKDLDSLMNNWLARYDLFLFISRSGQAEGPSLREDRESVTW